MECPPGGNIVKIVLSLSRLVNLGSEIPAVSHLSSFSSSVPRASPSTATGNCLERYLVMTQSRYSQLITSNRAGEETSQRLRPQ